MPPARALVDAGALVALATDFNPGSAFCDSLPLVLSLACTQMKLAPEEALVAATVNAAHVLGRADRIGRLEPGFAADVVLLDAPDWRHVAYHLGGRRRPHRGRRRSGRVPAHGIIPAMATQKQRRRRAKEKRHDYDLVYIDEDGVEQPVEREEEPRKPPARASASRQGRTVGRRARERRAQPRHGSSSAAAETRLPDRPRGAKVLSAVADLRADLLSPR